MGYYSQQGYSLWDVLLAQLDIDFTNIVTNEKITKKFCSDKEYDEYVSNHQDFTNIDKFFIMKYRQLKILKKHGIEHKAKLDKIVQNVNSGSSFKGVASVPNGMKLCRHANMAVYSCDHYDCT